MNHSKILLVLPAYTNDERGSAVLRTNGKSNQQPPLGLLTAAACLPDECELRLVDCNVHDLEERDIRWADIVMIGASADQRRNATEIVLLAKANGKRTVVGGVDTLDAGHFYDQSDHVVKGEAEIALPALMRDLQAGTAKHVYDFGKMRADVTKSPAPRYDLVELHHYLFPALQLGRGCPFRCEFCSVPAYDGRVPRYKTADQIRHELTLIYDLGYRGRVNFNDDNLIGNQDLCREALQAVIHFQKEKEYPFWFGAFATVNLCENHSLLELFREAGIGTVFLGIEAIDAETLKGHQKNQNLKFLNPDAIHTIFSYGIRITGGVIFGSDHESEDHGNQLFEYVQRAGIPNVNASYLIALPSTGLFARLESQGRIFCDPARDSELPPPLNFRTVRPREAIVKDFNRFMERVHGAKNYFSRINRMLRHFNPQRHGGKLSERQSFSKAILLKASKYRLFVRELIVFPSYAFFFVFWSLYWMVRDRQRFLLFLECSFEGLIRQNQNNGRIDLGMKVLRGDFQPLGSVHA